MNLVEVIRRSRKNEEIICSILHIPDSHPVTLYSENHPAFFILLPASFMASRTPENTVFAFEALPSIKRNSIKNVGGKLQLKHKKICANIQLFYDDINHRENVEKSS